MLVIKFGKNKFKKVYNWSDAYDFCRELDRPLYVAEDGMLTRIFPSGSYKVIGGTHKIIQKEGR